MFNSSLFAKQLAVFLFSFVLSACSDVNNIDEQISIKEKKSHLISLDVYKSPTCGCCSKWIDHIEQNGFQSKVHNRQQLAGIKDEFQIPTNARSCHTAVSNDGYVFEGHIPAKYIQKFLANPPIDSIGLTVPAMPLGSPGMEVDDKFMPYKIILLNNNGQHQIFHLVNSYEEQF